MRMRRLRMRMRVGIPVHAPHLHGPPSRGPSLHLQTQTTMRAPARFRETQLDTHKVVPANAGASKGSLSKSLTAGTASIKAAGTLGSARRRSATQQVCDKAEEAMPRLLCTWAAVHMGRQASIASPPPSPCCRPADAHKDCGAAGAPHRALCRRFCALGRAPAPLAAEPDAPPPAGAKGAGGGFVWGGGRSLACVEVMEVLDQPVA